jgi:hypothetical protein
MMVLTDEELADQLPPSRRRNPRYPTRDHVIPRRLRPPFDPSSGEKPWIVIVCVACNEDKGSRTIHEWRRSLHRWHDPRAAIVAAWADANPQATLTWTTEPRSDEGDGNGWIEQGDADRQPREGPGDQEAQ